MPVITEDQAALFVMGAFVFVCVVFIIMMYSFQPAKPPRRQPSGVRRHDGKNKRWYVDPFVDDRTVIIGQITREHEPKHAANNNMDLTVTSKNDYTIEPHNSTGRRSIENHARTIVPRDWMPPLGNARIALIETPTSEWMVVRRQHTRVRDGLVGAPPNFVRKYVTHPGMVNV